VTDAVPFLAFRLDRLLAGSSLVSVESRARAAAAAAALIAEHPNQIVREDYAAQIALRLGVRPEHLMTGQGDGGRRPTNVRAPSRQRRRAETASLLALGLAVHQPEAVCEMLHEVLFADPVELGAYQALARSTTLQEAVEEADPEVAELLLRLAVEEVADTDAGAVVGRLVDEATSRLLADMEVGFRTGASPGDDPQLFGWLKLRIEDLRDDAARAPAVEQLLPFLVARAPEPPETGTDAAP
jgi:DNA primase